MCQSTFVTDDIVTWSPQHELVLRSFIGLFGSHSRLPMQFGHGPMNVIEAREFFVQEAERDALSLLLGAGKHQLLRVQTIRGKHWFPACLFVNGACATT